MHEHADRRVIPCEILGIVENVADDFALRCRPVHKLGRFAIAGKRVPIEELATSFEDRTWQGLPDFRIVVANSRAATCKSHNFDFVPYNRLELFFGLIEIAGEIVVDRSLVVTIRIVLVPVVYAYGRPLRLDIFTQVEVEVFVGFIVGKAKPCGNGALFRKYPEIRWSQLVIGAIIEGEVADFSGAIARKRQTPLSVAPLDELARILLLERIVSRATWV